ncbi:hypothetical protein ACHAWO_010224 [Cyclotella atomus]|uniref:C2 domain-containing protein n=1 Tax=Cyclotella atomus TaxID=382360 RepID=A0ABD3PT05_9STRA
MGKVTITLEKLKNLKDTDGAVNHPDPYVTFELEKNNFGPLDKKYGKHTSTTKKCTCNPHYDETFVFEDVNTLENLELQIKVYDSDWGKDDHLGQKTIKLESKLTPGEEVEFDEDLDKDHKGMLSRDARIIMKILYEE